jgi:hypothetical protein
MSAINFMLGRSSHRKDRGVLFDLRHWTRNEGFEMLSGFDACSPPHLSADTQVGPARVAGTRCARPFCFWEMALTVTHVRTGAGPGIEFFHSTHQEAESRKR